MLGCHLDNKGAYVFPSELDYVRIRFKDQQFSIAHDRTQEFNSCPGTIRAKDKGCSAVLPG